MTTLGPVQTLARLAIQSNRYRDDPDFRDAVDDVLNVDVYDAAPDMLAALKASNDKLEAILFEPNHPLLKANRSAIARAEGRQP